MSTPNPFAPPPAARRISVAVPGLLFQELQARAAAENRSISNFCVLLLQRGLRQMLGEAGE